MWNTLNSPIVPIMWNALKGWIQKARDLEHLLTHECPSD